MTVAKIKRQRPERRLSETIADEKGKNKSLIDKRFTAMKAADGTGEFNSAIFAPTEEQMDKINQFTRSPKSADEVVCFSTLSCNDMLDRDLDRFTTDCVTDFAKLDGPLSSVGKSFMVSHDYTKLPVGRIFDVGTKDIEGVKFLTNDVYMPNTEANKNYIENLDFGIYWAVSVGVMLEDSACSVCESPMIGSWWTFCIENGHEKGLWYDPDSEEKDDWGWIEPVPPNTKGAVLCTRDLFNPKDFYELSQCFLGAQYDAQLQRGAMKGIIKAASTAKIPILNLTSVEADELPMQHVDPKVREAYAKGYKVESSEDGTVTWTDDSDLAWIYEAGESEVLCLGESKSETDDEGEEETEDGQQQEEPDNGDSPSADEALGVEDSDGLPDQNQPEGEHDSDHSDEEGVEEDSEEDDTEEEEVPKTSVVSAAQKAKLPSEMIQRAKDATGNGLDELLSSVSAKFAELEPKAVLGVKYVEEKRTEALKWYVKARQLGQEKGINTSSFQKLLDRLGDDIELIEEVAREQKEMAQAKFPASVRRSTVERDVNDVDDPADISALDRKSAEKVHKIHG